MTVETLANDVDERLPTPVELELAPGRPVLWRRAILQVDGRPVLRAGSIIALDRLGARAALGAGEYDARTYRILSGDRPLAVVTERIPSW